MMASNRTQVTPSKQLPEKEIKPQVPVSGANGHHNKTAGFTSFNSTSLSSALFCFVLFCFVLFWVVCFGLFEKRRTTSQSTNSNSSQSSHGEISAARPNLINQALPLRLSIVASLIRYTDSLRVE
jgi:hypothetical protein